MKKFILFLNMLLLYTCQAEENLQKDLPILKNYKSFEEFLYSSNFGSSSEMHSLELKFLRNGNFQIDYGSEGWYWNAFGQFKIENKQIVLTPTECEIWTEEGKSCEKMFQKAICKLTKDEQNKYTLSCKLDKKFFIYNSFADYDEFEVPLKGL